jgi:hypothetical protein
VIVASSSVGLMLLFLVSCQEEGKDKTSSETDTAIVGDTAAEADFCADSGYSTLPFDYGAGGSDYGALAADFTLETLDGEWNFAENWTGCDSYLFMNYAEGYDYPDQIWRSDMGDFLASSPLNAHYFFMSYDQGAEADQVGQIRERIDRALEDLSEEEQAHWGPRLHYVTESAWTAETVGDLLGTRGAWAMGIDRTQRMREVGYLADLTGSGQGDVRGLTYEARHYNFEVERDDALAALGADAYVSFDGERVGSGYAELSLPDAGTMASYDSMHIELSLGCGDPFYEDCGEWDYLIYAYVCDEPAADNTHADEVCQPYVAEVMGLCAEGGVATKDACREAKECTSKDKGAVLTCEGYVPAVAADTLACDCDDPDGSVGSATQSCNGEGAGYDDCACACDTEIGRWITSYARSGHWLMDASPALAWLKDGGERTIRFSSSYGYDNTLTFHLSDQGRSGSAEEVHALFTGGSFNSSYNDGRAPIEVEIPADATRVELYAIISGHGWGAEVENCAEFCNHTHHFTVDGTEYVKEHTEAGLPEGCIDQIELGTAPNQFGTWPYGRGGWCPGKQVDPWIVDVTDSVTPGEVATISYQGLFEGADYVPQSSGSGQGFGANINMRSYLVISR